MPAKPRKVKKYVEEEADCLLQNQELPEEGEWEEIFLPHDWAVERPFSRKMEQAEGPVEMLGVDNGDICGEEPYQSDRIHMYHGSASVQVRLTGEPGRAVIRAFAEGMAAGVATLLIGGGTD